jgi:peptide/nickel transport system substrate-binding protein
MDLADALPRWGELLTSIARLALGILLLSVVGCASPGPSRETGSTAGAERVPSKTLVLITRTEPETLGPTPITAMTTSTAGRRRLFNAALALRDGAAQPRPYLAEALPELNTDSWRVAPDGRMETTYRLRPDLAWHDGAPLTSADFGFAWQVYATPEFGRSNSEPINLMEEVATPDPRTVVVRWRTTYPDAGSLEGVLSSGNTGPSFGPLPRHLLEPSFLGDRAGFAALPYWTLEYVGAGPYRLERWDPGSAVEGVAFDRHALGAPKIDRIRLVFSPDANTVLANLLAGEVHLPVDDSLRIQAGLVLKREWEPRNLGRVDFAPRNWRVIEFQHRPEFANPSALLDVRVRRAIAHSVDKQAINEGLFEGVGIAADTMMYPTVDYQAALDAAIMKYPYDPRRAQTLVAEAGYVMGADGFFLDGGRGRLLLEITGTQSRENETERTILADGWRRVGLDTEQGEFTAQEMRDGLRLSTFRSMYATGSAPNNASLLRFKSDNISGPENRWTRSNRGGWGNAEYDRLVDAVQSTLDRGQQARHIVDALKILTESAGVVSLYFNPTVMVYPATITGMNYRAADAEQTWNIHEWALR